MAIQTCPICGAGLLHPHNELMAVEHLGQHGTIESHYAVCDACGSEQAGATEARLNKRAMIAFKKRVQGLLTGNEVRELRKRWGLSQEDAAKAFGGGPVAFSKYEADDVMQSDAMDKLLRLAADVPAALDKLLADAKILRQAEHWENIVVVSFAQYRQAKAALVQRHEISNEVSYG
ncbi:MAG: type II toxin-antitoxin system MqsA family antitoxin [Aeromonas sp.]